MPQSNLEAMCVIYHCYYIATLNVTIKNRKALDSYFTAQVWSRCHDTYKN